MRRRYLITYDVADDKRRTSLFGLCKDLGDHVQFSVFLAELTATELAGFRARASAIVHHDEDQVLIVDLGRADDAGAFNLLAEGIEAIGKAFEPNVRVQIV